MTTLELIAFLEYLESKGMLNLSIWNNDFEAISRDFEKTLNKDHWTDKFFPPSTPEK